MSGTMAALLHEPDHAADRYRRQPHSRILPARLRRSTAACAGQRRAADDRHRCFARRQRALALARAHPDILFATAGVHPHHAIDYDDATDALLRELASDPAVCAVGETGLDYNRNYSPHDVQLQVFERQLRLAVDVQKPLFLHQRDAHHDFLDLLRRYRDKVPAMVVHCFTDTGEALRDYLDLDCHIGITGWICD